MKRMRRNLIMGRRRRRKVDDKETTDSSFAAYGLTEEANAAS